MILWTLGGRQLSELQISRGFGDIFGGVMVEIWILEKNTESSKKAPTVGLKSVTFSFENQWKSMESDTFSPKIES